jgi:hypothetical protein
MEHPSSCSMCNYEARFGLSRTQQYPGDASRLVDVNLHGCGNCGCHFDSMLPERGNGPATALDFYLRSSYLLDCIGKRARTCGVILPGVTLGEEPRRRSNGKRLASKTLFHIFPGNRHRHCGPLAGSRR